MYRVRLHAGATPLTHRSSLGGSCGVVGEGCAAGLVRPSAAASSFLSADRTAAALALSIQRRFSFKYASKLQHNEMRQPFYNHEKRHGIFSNEHNIGKARRGLPYITPLDTKHMNLWSTDTDASTNRFFRSYVFGQRELHQLLGRTHGFEAAEVDGRNSDSEYELSTDLRYKGISRPSIINAHYEPEWQYTLYRAGSHGAQLTNPRSPLTAEVLGPELMSVRDAKSVEECKAWFDRLQYLIKLHYDAVGDIGDFKSRHTQHVHEFFVAFTDAISSFDFQDAYLVEHFKSVRPKELEDIFAIFLEMEANYVSHDHCPRCSLPYATTRYCGEGDTTTPFRKHRGRWAPHQRWGKEWYDVVCRRAEALWSRATEDPFFGTAAHTQRQVEGLLRVYVQTHQRGKAIDFMHKIRGSQEYLTGAITITAEMQTAFDHLLDNTPHPHMLTNGFKVESGASKYTGETNKVPHSPMQMRIDLEMDKYRRQQREEGVVKLPPAEWRLDTSHIVPYKLDAQKRVTNWREVKAGIEQSFLASGLPKEAYTSSEWREMLYLRDKLDQEATRRQQLIAELAEDRKKLMMSGAVNNGYAPTTTSSAIVFPDSDWYRVFSISADALKPFNSPKSGTVVRVVRRTFSDPHAVPYEDVKSGRKCRFDTTTEACQQYGSEFHHGQVLRIEPSAKYAAEQEEANGTPLSVAQGKQNVIVVGVNKEGAESEWALCAMYENSELHERYGVITLGTDVLDVRDRWESIKFAAPSPHAAVEVPILAPQYRVNEESLGQVVGVRNGVLYVQWRLLAGGGSFDRSVAVPLGTPDYIKSKYVIHESGWEALTEPPSWRTPFRNDWSEERLKELQKAPFERQKWAPLIEGKFTPKKKKFGYAQHTTQDDFVTKEYKDRLVAKQFFHSPQSFEVIPDVKERSVTFGSKFEYMRTNGVPSVDRNELENGWGEAAPIPDDEVAHVEQALRDISGRRPGNFLKTPHETQKLQINEAWWQPFQFGWDQHNREQAAFLDVTEQSLVNSSQLPFNGTLPPFGTSYGIVERMRDVAEDYAKGFGIGPHGHSPTNDATHFNTLGCEDSRIRTLGYSNPLVRLFDEKLGETDIHAWAVEQCKDGEYEPRKLLLSVNEWRLKGARPSLLLATVLSRYLKEELDAYNQGLPANVPRLAVVADLTSAENKNKSHVNGSGTSDGNIWAHVDKTEYGIRYAEQHSRANSDGSYILDVVHRASVSPAVLSSSFSDSQLKEYLRSNVHETFQVELARIVGKGISNEVLAQKSGQMTRGQNRVSNTVMQLVKSKELEKLLGKFGVTSQGIDTIIRGLSNCPGIEEVSGDFAIPTTLILTWSGPGTNQQLRHHNVGFASGNRSSAYTDNRRSERDKPMVRILEELSHRNDGYVMDVQYAARMNSQNPHLRNEFFFAMLPVYGGDVNKTSAHYIDYCNGNFVPNMEVAVKAFVKFIGKAVDQPDTIAEEYFQTGNGRYIALKMLSPDKGPFMFDCVSADHAETVQLFTDYGISVGPTRWGPIFFIAPNVQDLVYMSHRDDVRVSLSPNNMFNVQQELRNSPFFDKLKQNKKFENFVRDRNEIFLATIFNRFFHRTMPMLKLYHDALLEYVKMGPQLHSEATHSFHQLARILDNERSMPIEQEFRRNAERYWRNVLDGRNAEDYGSAGGAGGGGPAVGVGMRQRQRQQQQQNRNQAVHGYVSDATGGPRGGNRGGNSNMNGRAAAASGSSSSSGNSSSSHSAESAPPRPTSSAGSTSGLLNVLGTKKGSKSSSGGGGAAPAGGSGTSGSKPRN